MHRIDKAYSLNPERVILGSDGFEGYIVFTFAHTPKALLECPVHGNAVYLIDYDWERLSKLTKRELRSSHSEWTRRIVHRGEWFWRIKEGLQESA